MSTETEPNTGAPVFAAIDEQHLNRQREFSLRTFGPGARTKAVVDHIRKELKEVLAAPGDASEWADVIILGFDGALRAGIEPADIIAAIKAKQTRNEGRTWPDWRTADPDKAIEHVRTNETPVGTTRGSDRMGFDELWDGSRWVARPIAVGGLVTATAANRDDTAEVTPVTEPIDATVPAEPVDEVMVRIAEVVKVHWAVRSRDTAAHRYECECGAVHNNAYVHMAEQVRAVLGETTFELAHIDAAIRASWSCPHDDPTEQAACYWQQHGEDIVADLHDRLIGDPDEVIEKPERPEEVARLRAIVGAVQVLHDRLSQERPYSLGSGYVDLLREALNATEVPRG